MTDTGKTQATAEPQESRRDTWRGRAFGTVSYAAESDALLEDLRRAIRPSVSGEAQANDVHRARATGERRRVS